MIESERALPEPAIFESMNDAQNHINLQMTFTIQASNTNRGNHLDSLKTG